MNLIALQECTRLQDYLLTGEYLDIPVTLRGKGVVPVFYNKVDKSICVPEESLPFVMAVLVGIEPQKLQSVLARNPFDLLNFVSTFTCERIYGINSKNAFSHKVPGGQLLSVVGLLEQIIKAFAAHDPHQLITQAEAIQKLNEDTIYSLMATKLPGVDLGGLIERNRERCRLGSSDADFVGKLEWKLSIAQYSMDSINEIPSLDIDDFLRKSGALNRDYINGLMSDEIFFWEGLFTAAAGDETRAGGYTEPPRKEACHRVAQHLFDVIEKHAPGAVDHIIRSLDFTRGSRFDKVEPRTLEYLVQYAPPDSLALRGTLWMLGALKSHKFDSDRPFVSQVVQLNRHNRYPGLEDLIQTPGFIVHRLLSEIIEMPDEHIGFNVFSSLGFLSTQMLSEQEFSEEVVTTAMLKVAKALGRFVMLHAPVDTSKYFVDEICIKGIRDFNSRFLKPWGLDKIIFEDADPTATGILVAVGFDLPLDGVAPGLLTHRFEADLGL